jgi:hypothetical protein
VLLSQVSSFFSSSFLFQFKFPQNAFFSLYFIITDEGSHLLARPMHQAEPGGQAASAVIAFSRKRRR